MQLKIWIRVYWILYVGLMIKNENLIFEFNVRMGDPECQTILRYWKMIYLKYFLIVV